MTTLPTTTPKPRRRRLQFGLRTLLIVMVVAALTSYAMRVAYRSVSRADRAERSLQATLLTIEVVNNFVRERGRWPQYWDEMKAVSASPGAIYSWPQDAQEVQQYVTINFQADLASIASQAASDFTEIRPMGPCFPYRDYEPMQTLLDTARAVTTAQQQVPATSGSVSP